MKKILSMIMLFVITLVSCKKDDPTPQPIPPAVKENPLPTVSGIYRGDNTSTPVFTAEFFAIQGTGIGEIVILAENSGNPMQNYLSIQIPEIIQNKDPKTISSTDLKGNPTVTLTGTGENDFKGETKITILSIKRENSFLGISGKDKNNKEILIVFPVK